MRMELERASASCRGTLPSTQIYRLLKAVEPSESASMVDAVLLSNVIQRHHRTIQARLRTVLPSRDLDDSDHPNEAQACSAAFLQLLLFGATNNFAEIEYHLPGLNIDRWYNSLIPFACHSLPHDELLLRPLSESLFLFALRTGDTDLVAILLNSGPSNAGIDINDRVCIHSGMRVTPVELSAGLGHRALTRLLISHGAILNRTLALETFSLGQPRGALEWALRHTELSSNDPSLVSAESGLEHGKHAQTAISDVSCAPATTLVGDILAAGGDFITLDSDGIPHKAIEAIETTDDRATLECLLKHLLRDKLEAWVGKHLLHTAFLRIECQKLEILVRHMAGADLNLASNDLGLMTLLESPHDPCNVAARFHRFMLRKLGGQLKFTYIDIAARRGLESVVRLLVGQGAQLTPNVLPAAIRSGNKTLVRFLLDLTAQKKDEISPAFHATTYSDALLLRDQELVRHCEQSGCFQAIRDGYHQAVTLAAAAHVGDLTLVKRLLGLNYLFDTELLAPALVNAAAANHTDICIAVLTAGAPLFDFGEDWAVEKHHPLMAALRNKNAVLVSTLLIHGVGWTHQEEELEEAVRWGNRDVLEQLIKAGVPVGNSLAVAIACENFWAFHQILSLGARQDKLAIALTTSVKMQQSVITMQLMEAGADPANTSAFTHALDHAHVRAQPVFDRFATLYARGKQGFGAEILTRAITAGRKDQVDKLLSMGVGVRTRIERPGYCCEKLPIAEAISKDQGQDFGMVTRLLESNPDLDYIVRTKYGTVQGEVFPTNETPLLVAISTMNLDMVAFLIEKGADFNYPASGLLKRTPLQRAAEIGSMEIVELLLRKGADVNALPAKREGTTALQAAARSGYIGIAEMLLAHGADLTAHGSTVWGRTALQAAARQGRLDMVQFLSDYGPHTVEDCQDALTLAKYRGHMAVAEMLKTTISTLSARNEFSCQLPHMVGDLGHDAQSLTPTQSRMTTQIRQDEGTVAEKFDTSSSAVDVDASPIQSRSSSSHLQECETNAHLNKANQLGSNHQESNKMRCRTCSKQFSSASTLRRHQKCACDALPSAGPRLRCSVCNKRFSRKDIYVRHQAIHEKSHQVACERCGGVFSRKDYLKVHLKSCKGGEDGDSDTEHVG